VLEVISLILKYDRLKPETSFSIESPNTTDNLCTSFNNKIRGNKKLESLKFYSITYLLLNR
jgi:hypothetical protein